MSRSSDAWWQGLPLRVGGTVVALDLTGLAVIPAAVWAVGTLYVPILGSFLSVPQTWLVALLIVVFACVSLAGHVLAHAWAARLTGTELPHQLSLLVFGDTAQVWPAAPTPWRELAAACAGPGLNLLLAGSAYLGWNAQLTPVLNLGLLFTCAFNIWLVVANLIPAFPLDGGRITRALIWGLAGRPAEAGRLAQWLGAAVAISLGGWALFLYAQHTRFSPETAGATLGFALLLLAGLTTRAAWQWDRPAGRSTQPVGAVAAAILVLGLLAVAASLTLTNDGIEAPGFALSVEPMVEVSAPHRFSHPGTFILTSVVSQTPITAGEWALAKVDPAVRLVPPETVVPDNTTPQSLARQGFQQLDESTAIATVVGLQQAGYDARLVGKGAAVVSILPGSPAQGKLQPGDVITSLDGNPVTTTSDLILGVQALGPRAAAQLQVARGEQSIAVAVPLMPPDAASPHPHMGVLIESAGVDMKLPFAVKITPQKIVGGPSAGLMFTLAVYNLVTPRDLTGGRKIAGTGTMSLDGTVGPIGGVEQKVAAAEAAGAAYFLAPADNYAAARAVARHIQVVKVATVEEAIAFLRGLPAP
jgi:PDZ domain-containing protein